MHTRADIHRRLAAVARTLLRRSRTAAVDHLRGGRLCVVVKSTMPTAADDDLHSS